MAKTLIVDSDIHQRFKTACGKTGTTMADATVEALAFWIAFIAAHKTILVATELQYRFTDEELREIIALLVKNLAEEKGIKVRIHDDKMAST